MLYLSDVAIYHSITVHIFDFALPVIDNCGELVY